MGKIAVNDSTGDRLISRTLSKQGEANWDLIFGKKKSRIDVVGQNGNDGLHYEYELDKSTGEVIRKEN